MNDFSITYAEIENGKGEQQRSQEPFQLAYSKFQGGEMTVDRTRFWLRAPFRTIETALPFSPRT